MSSPTGVGELQSRPVSIGLFLFVKERFQIDYKKPTFVNIFFGLQLEIMVPGKKEWRFIQSPMAVLMMWLVLAMPSQAQIDPESNQPVTDASVAAEDDGQMENAQQEPAVATFDIWEYQVEGNTVLDVKTIQTAVYPFLGPDRTGDDVDAAATELERAYKNAGFPVVFVEVPEQNIVAGVVRLRVVQGEVSRVRVSGSEYFTLSGIKEKLPSIKTGQPLHVPSMQKDLNALNASSADLKVLPLLKPGKKPGQVEVELKVKDEPPMHGSLEVNDYNSSTTSSLRAAASLSYANLWQKQHSASLQYQTAPEEPDEVQVWVGTYLFPVNTTDRVALYYVDSNSDVSSVGGTTVIGEGEIIGLRYVIPLESSREFIHSFTAGFDYKNFDEIVRLDVSASDKTPIEYGVWSFSYATIYPSRSSMTKLDFNGTFGMRGVFNEEDEFAFKRYGGKANFSYGKITYDREDYWGSWTFHSYGRWQIADSPLINNEQFGVGGPGTVRGYYQSQQLADQGVNLGLELFTPSVFSWGEYIKSTRFLLFGEWAELDIKDPLPEQEDNFNLAGAGLGLRMASELGFDFSFDWAYALEDNATVQSGDARSHVMLNYSF